MQFIYNHNKPGIYKITNVVNKKCYIGSTMFLYGRFKDHKRNLNDNIHKPNKKFQAAWNKYGENNFIFEILEVVDYIKDKKALKEALTIKEQYWVNILNPEYNINKTCVTSNYGSRWKLSGTAKRNVQLAHPRGRDTYNAKKVVLLDIDGNYINTFDTCQQCSEYLQGYIKGASMVTMCCKHQVNSIKNKFVTFYEQEWINVYSKNKKLLDDLLYKSSKQAIHDRLSKAQKHYYSTTPNAIEQCSKRQNIPVLQFDKQGNFLREFESIKQAKQITGAHGIISCCQGKQKSAGGFVFKYKSGGRKKNAV